MSSPGGVDPTFINSILGGSNNSLSDDITNTNINMFGSGNDPTSSTILATAVEKLQAFWNNLVGSGNDPTTSKVQAASVANVLGGSSLGADVTSVSSTASSASSAAAAAVSTANTGQGYTGTFLGYARILADVLHATYPKGTSSDTPTTTSGGLPTWFSAWNGLLALEGIVKSSTAPTDTAPTTGDVIAANTAAATTASTNASTAISSNQAVMNTLVTSQSGVTVTGAVVSDVDGAMTNIAQSSIQGFVAPNVTFGALGGSTQRGGATANNITVTGSHTPLATDTALYVTTTSVYAMPYGINSASVTATINGVAVSMTQINTVVNGSTTEYPNGWVVQQDTWRVTLTPTIVGSPAAISLSAFLSASGWLWLWINSISYYGSKVNNNPTFFTTTDLTQSGTQLFTLNPAPASIAARQQLVIVSMIYTSVSTLSGNGGVQLASGSNAVTSRWKPSGWSLGSHAPNYNLLIAAGDAAGGDADYKYGNAINGSSDFAYGVGTIIDISN